jgi:hypothetical protein
MAEIKSMIAAGVDVVGYKFITPVGVSGIVLSEKKDNKYQAELQCIVKDCKNTHIRVASDWHQCSKCLDHTTANKNVAPKDIQQRTEENKIRLEESRAHMLTIKSRISEMIEKYNRNVPK